MEKIELQIIFFFINISITISYDHEQQGDSLHHLSSLSLTKPLKKPIREIIKRYQLADRDKTFEVQVLKLADRDKTFEVQVLILLFH